MKDLIGITLKPFYFLRHGETDWNKLKVYSGSKDISLNCYGTEQALKAAHILINQDIKHIITSPLKRASKTAEIISDMLKVRITIIEELAECNWGKYEGKPHNGYEFLKQWLIGNHFDGVEPVRDFEKRVLDGFKKALEFPEPILIVSHGAVYSAMRRIMGFPSIDVENCRPIFHNPLSTENMEWEIYKIEK